MNHYSYNGPVMKFGTCIQHNWKGETTALSEKKARSNLIYQWKKNNKMAPSAKITLPGKVTLVE